MTAAYENSERLTLQGFAGAGFPVLCNARSKGRRNNLGGPALLSTRVLFPQAHSAMVVAVGATALHCVGRLALTGSPTSRWT